MRNLKTFGSVLFIGLASVNCGGAPDPAALPPQAGCVAGQPGCAVPMPGPMTLSQFETECFNGGGYPYPMMDGGKICNIRSSRGAQGPLKLNPSNPAGAYPLNLGMIVRTGDTIHVSNARGCWTSGSVILSFFGSCSGINENGVDKDGVTLTHDGQPQGLLFSNGQQVFRSGAPVVATSDGLLRMGFNSPGVVNPASTASAQISITRCINAQGNLYTCSGY